MSWKFWRIIFYATSWENFCVWQSQFLSISPAYNKITFVYRLGQTRVPYFFRAAFERFRSLATFISLIYGFSSSSFASAFSTALFLSSSIFIYFSPFVDFVVLYTSGEKRKWKRRGWKGDYEPKKAQTHWFYKETSVSSAGVLLFNDRICRRVEKDIKKIVKKKYFSLEIVYLCCKLTKRSKAWLK